MGISNVVLAFGSLFPQSMLSLNEIMVKFCANAHVCL